MTIGTVIEPGTVVLIAVPFTDLSERKKRPAVVLQQFRQDILICGITSNLNYRPHGILLAEDDFALGKLPKKSQATLSKLFTIQQDKVMKCFGKLNSKKFEEIKQEFRTLV